MVTRLYEGKKEVMVTQWINDQEWITVCSWLYDNKIEERMKGVRRVAAWRARGVVPFPIESTVDIVECIINEEKQTETQQSLCLMYSMTITRFINGIFDYGVLLTNRGAIYDVVKEFGIPFWLVQLRHDSTHRVLPSHSLLLEGVWFCYHWLNANYWQLKQQSLQTKVTDDQMSFIVNEQESEETASEQKENDVCNNLQLSDKSYFSTINLYRTCPDSLKLRKISKLLSKATPNDFVTLLKERLFLYPTKIIDFELTNIPDKNDLSSIPILNESLYSYWKPLLYKIGQLVSSVKTTIITAIISVMHCPSTDHKWVMMLAGWLGALFSIYTIDGELMEGDIVWGRIVEVLKNNPGYYSYPLMEICVNQLLLDSDTIKNILQLTKLVTLSQRNGYTNLQPSLTTITDCDTNVYRNEFEDFKLKVSNNSVTSMDTGLEYGNEDKNGNQWKKASGDWYNVPIGCVLFNKHLLTATSLNLSVDYNTVLEEHTLIPMGKVETALDCSSKSEHVTMDTDCVVLDQSNDGLTHEQLQLMEQTIKLY